MPKWMWLLPCSLVLAACTDARGVGLACVLEKPARGDERAAESPSLDCETRLCVQLTEAQPAMCSDACASVGEPCPAASTAGCTGEFRCEVPFQVGPFTGRALCVCDASPPATD